jgi:hypothetical protein
MTADPQGTPHPTVRDEVVTVRVRRAPKIGVFLVAGAVLGILAALVLTFSFDGTERPSPNTTVDYTTMQVFGFVTLICVPIGLVLGAVVALVLDRTVGRRTRPVRVDHKTIRDS